MMGNLWTVLLYQPLLNGVVGFYHLFGNMGWAIVAFTGVLRLVLTPLTLPALRAGQKMKELAPRLGKLQKKYKNDKKKLAEVQMQLYREEGVNPAAGCVPQIVQIVVLIALYQAFNQVLKTNGETIQQLNDLLYGPLKLVDVGQLNLRFFYLSLDKPDVFSLSGVPFPVPGGFLAAAAISQFLASRMMAPVVKEEEKVAKKTETGMDDAMAATQKNMMYIFPVMTLVIGFTFPSGLVLYWLVFSAFQLLQQYALSRKWSILPRR